MKMSQTLNKLNQIASNFNRKFKPKHKPGESTSSRPGWMVRDSHLTHGGLRMTNTTAGTFTELKHSKSLSGSCRTFPSHGILSELKLLRAPWEPSHVRHPLMFIVVLSLLAFPFFLTTPTHADDSITITIDDSTVDLNIATTNPNGTFSKSNNSNISVKTTNSTGYTLGIRAEGSDPTKLINSSDPDTTTNSLSSITSATTEEQFKSLAATTLNGKWGYLPSKLCTSDSNSSCSTNTSFLPAPTTIGDTLDITTTANPTTANTYQLALGARVDSTQKLGSYSNNIYVIYADANAIAYSITYDDNVVSNMPSDVNSGQAVGGQLNIASNVPVRSGYKFLGWCTVATADPASSTSDCTTAGGTFYSANQAVTISAATNFHLYAMWGESVSFNKAFANAGKTQSGGYYKLQDMSSSICSAVDTDEIGQLIDTRDNEIYYVGKLADNKCWMLDNLRLDPTAVDLATLQGNTNASDTTLGYLKNGGGTSPYTGTAVANKTGGFTQYDTPNVNVGYKDNTTTSYGSGSGKVGVYYNYCAASAGSYCYSSSSSTGNASEDICPAGWRMPTGGGSGEYQALYTAYSSDATNFRNALSTPLSGYFYNSSRSYLGSNGYFWSSTRYSITYMYYLFVYSSSVYPLFDDYRYYGYSVRCVAQ